MARPRTFDHEQVVRRATRQFWRAGWHGTSAEDLCQATGLGRSSLYNAFGGKDQLFTECLTGYLIEARTMTEEILADSSGDVPVRIETLLRHLASDEQARAASGDARGCLAVNTVTELADDPAGAGSMALITADTAARQGALADVLRTGQAAGQITASLPAEGLAAYLDAAICGIRVASQRGAASETIDQIVRATLLALRP